MTITLITGYLSETGQKIVPQFSPAVNLCGGISKLGLFPLPLVNDNVLCIKYSANFRGMIVVLSYCDTRHFFPSLAR